MKTNSIIKSTLLAASFSAMALIGSAKAQVVINVDVNEVGGTSGTYSGQGAYSDGSNDFWNPLSVSGSTVSASASNLMNSSHSTATGVNLSISTSYTFGENPDLNAFDSDGAPTAGVAPALMNDFAWVENDGSTGTFTFSNLTVGDTYDLYVYSQNAGYDSEATTFTVDGHNMSLANTNADSSFTAGANYVEFTGLVIDSSTDLIGTWPGNPTNGGVDGFTLVDTTVEAPEPSTYALLGLGALGLAFLAVRRRHSLV